DSPTASSIPRCVASPRSRAAAWTAASCRHVVPRTSHRSTRCDTSEPPCCGIQAVVISLFESIARLNSRLREVCLNSDLGLHNLRRPAMSDAQSVRRLTVPDLTARKGREKIVVLTAYTTPIAQL